MTSAFTIVGPPSAAWAEPRVLWREARSPLNMPPKSAAGPDADPALRRGLGLNAISHASGILRWGTPEEMKGVAGAREVTDRNFIFISEFTRSTVFLNPPTRVTSVKFPNVVPPAMLDSVAIAAKEGRSAIWTRDHEAVWQSLTEEEWKQLDFLHWIETVGQREWRARVKDNPSDLWSAKEAVACQERLAEQKRQFKDFYDFHNSTLPHTFEVEDEGEVKGEVDLEKREAGISSSIWVMPRSQVDVSRIKGLDATAYAKAKWVVYLKGTPKAGAEPFDSDVHAAALATGEACLSAPDIPASSNAWPRLLSNAESVNFETAYRSLSAEQYDALNVHQWRDWLMMTELARKYENNGSTAILNELGTYESRYQRRRYDCLALYDLRYQLGSSSLAEKVVITQADNKQEEAGLYVLYSGWLASLRATVGLAGYPPMFPPVVPPPTLPIL
ncbi:hypothetical protein JCM10213_008972 [Rhodosporidiobolus nylandii]